MLKILLCSGNKGKIKEFKAMAPGNILLIDLEQAGLPTDLLESGTTLEHNAMQKARFGFEKTGLPSLADDSGLEVDVLGGAPGVRSGRFAGESKDDLANVQKLLKELDGKVPRNARFRTVIAFVHQQGGQLFEGMLEGQILEAPRGRNGFGYDPVFRPAGSDRSLAEMDIATKNSISHRYKALHRFFDYLKDFVPPRAIDLRSNI